ncbi:MAG: hypothetical protein ABSG31_03125 [Tepidisphaeraceae bacterium]|jgi:hypothetical protein
MNSALRSTAIALLCSCLGGCAIYTGVHEQDLSHDPKYQGGYSVGDSYQLNSDGWLFKPAPADDHPELFLRSFDVTTRPSDEAETKLALIPKGSTVHIDKLAFEDDQFLFEEFNLGGSIVHPHFGFFAYGTITTGSAKWTDVKMPTCRPYPGMKFAPIPSWSSAHGDVIVLGPDPSFLTPISQ